MSVTKVANANFANAMASANIVCPFLALLDTIHKLHFRRLGRLRKSGRDFVVVKTGPSNPVNAWKKGNQIKVTRLSFPVLLFVLNLPSNQTAHSMLFLVQH